MPTFTIIPILVTFNAYFHYYTYIGDIAHSFSSVDVHFCLQPCWRQIARLLAAVLLGSDLNACLFLPFVILVHHAHNRIRS